ncbi:response regulator [Natronorubrum sp. JWXQ-INN-674]|uniref:Response regulator n=1 Tax=Natronorubrum halalkaliphilum TaxID=2691917 RepID=A0A6B0VQW8_9EURY|nr:response regulator [Natronorubrum halalkaliphilum]MXV63406.1 response regulator [Natronorubrum halalkaliphilum]
MIDRSKTADPANVLLVEPADETARLARTAFSNDGSKTTIHTVSDGEAALEFLHRCGEYADAPRPCLVILRLDLPDSGPDGTAVLEEMRQATTLARIPVVVTVDSPTPDTASALYQLGANAVVSTPADSDSLLETLELVAQFWIDTARLPNRNDRC